MITKFVKFEIAQKHREPTVFTKKFTYATEQICQAAIVETMRKGGLRKCEILQDEDNSSRD